MHSSGLADVETGQPLRANTILRFYSMTKPVTSVCAMILYERGLFQLDEPISHHLPSFASPRVLQEDGSTVPACREIIVRDLLTHTAGLSYGDTDTDIDELYMSAKIGSNTPANMTLAEFVDRLGRLPLIFHPGESWRYSYATDVLGRLLEVLTGLPLDVLLHKEIFEPLGMIDSSFSIGEHDHARRARFAQVYEADEGNIEVGELARRRRRFERSNAYLLHCLRGTKPQHGAAGHESDAEKSTPDGGEGGRKGREAEARTGRTRTAVISTAAQPGMLDTPDCPKVLSPLAGEPMLIQILRQLRLGGITRVIVITGFRGAQVRDTLSRHPIVTQLDIIFVDVGETYSDGFARSLLAAAQILNGEEWLLCCPDRIFHKSLVEELCNAPLTGKALGGANGSGRTQRAEGDSTTPTEPSPVKLDAVVLAEPKPGREHRSKVLMRLEEPESASAAPWKGSALRRVLSLWERSEKEEEEEANDANGSAPDAPSPGILETGLFKCSSSFFDVMATIASTLPHFSMVQAMQKVAEDGRLAAISTDGRKWFAVEGDVEIDHRLAGLVRSPALGQTAATQLKGGSFTAPRVVKADSFSRSVLESELLSAAKPAKPRFHILPDEDGGDYTSGRVAFLSGGAGMLSSAHDYARFAQMLLNKGELEGTRILSRKTLEYMTRNQLPLEGAGAVRRADIDAIATDSGFNETSFDGIGFGLGWSVVQDPIKATLLCSQGEFGWGGWASTFFAVDPSEDMFVLSLSQLAPSDRYPIRRQLRCLMYQALT